MKKQHAFWVTEIILVAIFAGVFFVPGAMPFLPSLGPTLILGLLGNAGVFISGAVADNWQRSKFYRPELDENHQPGNAGNQGGV